MEWKRESCGSRNQKCKRRIASSSTLLVGSVKVKSEKQSKIFAPTIKAASKGKVRAKEGKFEGIPTQLQAISGQLGQQGPSAAPPSGVKRITSKTKRSARAKVA